jgi:hypothetical protein
VLYPKLRRITSTKSHPPHPTSVSLSAPTGDAAAAAVRAVCATDGNAANPSSPSLPSLPASRWGRISRRDPRRGFRRRVGGRCLLGSVRRRDFGGVLVAALRLGGICLFAVS